MRVLIIGASKGIGLETTRQALAAGYHVRALARPASAIGLSNPRLEKVSGDALNHRVGKRGRFPFFSRILKVPTVGPIFNVAQLRRLGSILPRPHRTSVEQPAT